MKTEAWTRILHTLATITRQAGEELVERITTPVNLTVLPDGGNQSSPHLWGIMFEVLKPLHHARVSLDANICRKWTIQVRRDTNAGADRANYLDDRF